MNRVDEIRNTNYIPNNDDILQSRRRTSDIQKLEFQVKIPLKSNQNIQQTFCMFDVGGQRGERRKWIQVFDGVSAVVFLIDSSSFDAIDDENGRNKLRETINLFYEVWTTRFLLNSNFVLLFNKQDILREKIARGHKIEDHFPEYKLYKCPSQDRALTNKAGEKLNLFRQSSRPTENRSASSRSTSSANATLSARDPSGPPKSSTLGRPSLMKPQSISLLSPESCHLSDPSILQSAQRHNLNDHTNNNNQSKSPSLARQNTSPASTGTDYEQRQISAEQAYIRARSFIRDKFLQITRQVDQEKRKFSTPSLVYNSRGCVDQPKRNVCYHYTTATDTENVRDLFENLQKMVIKSTMKNLRS